MLKGILNVNGVQKLSKSEQLGISGNGLSEQKCNQPYFVPDGVCEPGDFNHPVFGHCVCCKA